MTRVVASAILVALTGTAAMTTSAQTADQPLSFDVVAIEPSRESRPTGTPLRGGRMVMTGRTLHDLISASYLLHSSQILGVEPWMTPGCAVYD